MDEIRNITKFYKNFSCIIILYPLHYLLNFNLTYSRIRNLSLNSYSSISLFSYMYVGREDPSELKILKKKQNVGHVFSEIPHKKRFDTLYLSFGSKSVYDLLTCLGKFFKSGYI